MERVRDDNKSLQRPGQKRKLTEEHRDHIYDRIHTDPHVTYESLIQKTWAIAGRVDRIGAEAGR